MAEELRKTGISVVGDVPWGTHFCHFYETKQDLLDTLVPYFKAGLESREFCVWVVSDSQLITVEEAKGALKEAVPDLDRHLSNEDIEILNGLDWYLEENVFNLEGVTKAWDAKLKRALARGYDGMRVSGDTFWLTEKDWKDFFAYEKQLNDSITDQPMTVLCTYPLAKSGAAEVLDVVHAHQFAIARRQGEWEVVETPELIQAKTEIKRLNEELELRVVERTRELAAANEALRREIAERKGAEDALRRSEDHLRLVIDTIPVMAWSTRPDGVVDFLNQRWVDYAGLSLEQYVVDPTGPVHPEDVPRVMEKWLAQKAIGEGYEDELRLRRADGEYRWFLVRTAPLRDEHGEVVKWYGVSIDIEDRKRAEDRLTATTQQLRALSARVQMAREEESTRIARELHDELGSALTSLKWNLDLLEKGLVRSTDDDWYSRQREQIKDMRALIDDTIYSVRRISAELRPSVLDDLGLVSAVRSYLLQFQERTGIVTRFESLVDNIELTSQQSTALFRIVQEALTNVLRHARATMVEISVRDENGQIALTISDNGRGITESEKSAARSLGLLGMEERARLVGGKIDIARRKEGGTVIIVLVPIARNGG